MSSHVVKVTDLVIPNGQTDSNIIYATRDFQDADGITIFSPAVMPETVTVYVSPVGEPNSPPSASDFRALQTANADQTLAAGKAETIILLPYKAIKVVASAAVAADRTFNVNKLMWA
jgi:hypothetical protein